MIKLEQVKDGTENDFMNHTRNNSSTLHTIQLDDEPLQTAHWPLENTQLIFNHKVHPQANVDHDDFKVKLAKATRQVAET